MSQLPHVKFSSHVQLQYLMHKFKINTRELHDEMTLYYGNPKVWEPVVSRYGTITAVKLKAGATKPVSKKPAATQKPKPKVTIKRKFNLVRD